MKRQESAQARLPKGYTLGSYTDAARGRTWFVENDHTMSYVVASQPNPATAVELALKRLTEGHAKNIAACMKAVKNPTLHQVGETAYYLIDEDSTNPHRLVVWRKRSDGTKVLEREIDLSQPTKGHQQNATQVT